MSKQEFIVAVAADGWQEHTFNRYSAVIAYLMQFGISAPAPRKAKMWGEACDEYQIHADNNISVKEW